MTVPVAVWIAILHLGTVVGVLPYSNGYAPATPEGVEVALETCYGFIEDRTGLAGAIEAAGYRVAAVTLDCVASAEPPKLGETR